jgi:hypothetical protein
MTTFLHHPTTDDLYKLMRTAVPECACFEFVGDNPYCPVHGKPAEPATIGEATAVAYGVSELHPEDTQPDQTKSNLEFGSAAWFAGIPELEF